jgi:hypothetical protein
VAFISAGIYDRAGIWHELVGIPAIFLVIVFPQ